MTDNVAKHQSSIYFISFQAGRVRELLESERGKCTTIVLDEADIGKDVSSFFFACVRLNPPDFDLFCLPKENSSIMLIFTGAQCNSFFQITFRLFVKGLSQKHPYDAFTRDHVL